MNTEYEYSFKVKDITPFINYCIKNSYKKIEEYDQTRIIYENENNTRARITITNESNILLDFKVDNISNGNLIESRETLPIKIENLNSAESILDFLKYKKSVTLVRRRVIYKKDLVIFEIDDYKSPDKMLVVAIEGEKEETDKVYEEIKIKFEEYIL